MQRTTQHTGDGPEDWAKHLRWRTFVARDQLLIRIFQAGYGQLREWWTNRRVTQISWALYMNDQDGAEVHLSDGRTVALRAGRAWVLPPWSSYARRARRIHHQWIHFDLAGIVPSVARNLFPGPCSIVLDHALRAVSASLRHGIEGNAASDAQLLCQAQAVVSSCMARLLAQLPDADRRRLVLGGGEADLAPALHRINEGLSGPLYNEALARACSMSASRFSRRFRAVFGQSPAQYVIERRIAMAASQLLFTERQIEVIASECGFADRFAFTRAFTRRIGYSPARYRAGQQHSAQGS